MKQEGETMKKIKCLSILICRINTVGNHRYGIVALFLAFNLLLIGCNTSTPINNILENPRDYAGKPVKISGEVTEVFSLVVVKYFVVKDKTGEIIVVTKRPLPREGTKITVKGTVQEAFSIGDKQLIVIVENPEKVSQEKAAKNDK